MTAEQGTALATAGKSDLVMRIAAGEREAEDEFVRAYQYGVRVLLRRNCRPGDPVVDDLVQDVLSSVLERLRSGAVRDVAALPAYVRTTVVNAAKAEYRRRPKTQPLSEATHLSAADDPPRLVADHETAALLRGVIEEMAVLRDRRILARFYLDELSKDDVCRELGIDPEHFHRVVFRARARFRELLELRGLGVA